MINSDRGKGLDATMADAEDFISRVRSDLEKINFKTAEQPRHIYDLKIAIIALEVAMFELRKCRKTLASLGHRDP